MINISNNTNNNSNDLIKVLNTLKDNISKSVHVAEVCRIDSVYDDGYYCKTLNYDMNVDAISFQAQEYQENDLVLVVFCDTDFRVNLKKYKNNQNTTIVDKEHHSMSYGIIVGLIYREEEEA